MFLVVFHAEALSFEGFCMGAALALLEPARLLVPTDEELACDLGTIALNASRYDLASHALESVQACSR